MKQLPQTSKEVEDKDKEGRIINNPLFHMPIPGKIVIFLLLLSLILAEILCFVFFGG